MTDVAVSFDILMLNKMYLHQTSLLKIGGVVALLDLISAAIFAPFSCLTSRHQTWLSRQVFGRRAAQVGRRIVLHLLCMSGQVVIPHVSNSVTESEAPLFRCCEWFMNYLGRPW